MRLREMNADQATEHYTALIRKRMARVAQEAMAVSTLPASNAKQRLRTKLRAASKRAMKMAFKGEWQVQAAADLYKTYGVNVAVGFLRAYGWEHSPDLFYRVTGKRMR